MNNLTPSFPSKLSWREVRDFCDAAESADNAAIVSLLDKYGASLVSGEDDCGRTALLHLAQHGHSGAMSLLLGRGANINHKDRYDNTVLILAAYFGHKDSVAFLLENGADVAAKDDTGKTALMWAEFRGRDEIAELLQQWPELLRQRELAAIEKTVRGGLAKDTPYKKPFKFPPGGKP